MDPLQILRLLRKRWVVLFVLAALGAAAGYASTLRDDDVTGPVQSYWAADAVLSASDVSNNRLDRLGPFVTGGDVPRAVAQQLGIETVDLVPTIRTITDAREATFTISVVALDPEDARTRAEALSQELRDSQNRDQVLDYETELQRLTDERDMRQSEAVAAEQAENDAEAAIDAAEASEVADPDNPDQTIPGSATPEQEDALSAAEIQSGLAFTRLLEAGDALEAFIRQGPPQGNLEPLASNPPIQITEREYNARLNAGSQGQANYTIGEVGLAEIAGDVPGESALAKPQTRAVAGGIAGLLIGLMAVLIQWRLDPRVRSREEVEEAFGLPVLAEIPLMRRLDRRKNVLHARDKARSSISEAHRYLRSLLLYAGAVSPADADQAEDGDQAEPVATGGVESDREVRVVMVTSPGSSEGKTTTASNLAVVMAEAGYKTLLFNCDHRLPRAHQVVGAEYLPSKTQTIAEVPNLTFVADVARLEGESPAAVAARQADVIDKARNRFDVVIVDTAPIMATNDAIDLLAHTDLVVLVVREGKTTRNAGAETREIIDRIGTPIAGVVITHSGAALGSRYYERYRYGGYYGNRAGALPADAAGPRRAAPDDRTEPATPAADAPADLDVFTEARTAPYEPEAAEVTTRNGFPREVPVVRPDPTPAHNDDEQAAAQPEPVASAAPQPAVASEPVAAPAVPQAAPAEPIVAAAVAPQAVAAEPVVPVPVATQAAAPVAAAVASPATPAAPAPAPAQRPADVESLFQRQPTPAPAADHLPPPPSAETYAATRAAPPAQPATAAPASPAPQVAPAPTASPAPAQAAPAAAPSQTAAAPAPQAPAAPQVTQAPQAPAAPQVTQAPQAPAGPQASQAQQAPAAPQVTQAPQAPAAPQASQVTQAPAAPVAQPAQATVATPPPAADPSSTPAHTATATHVAPSIEVVPTPQPTVVSHAAQYAETTPAADPPATAAAMDLIAALNPEGAAKNARLLSDADDDTVIDLRDPAVADQPRRH